MKLPVILLLAALPLPAPAQELTTIADIPLGTKQDRVIQLMIKKHDQLPRKLKSTLVYNNLELGQYRVKYAAFYLHQDKVYQADAMVRPEKKKTLETYATIVEELKKQYGAPSMTVDEFELPYMKGDGHHEKAFHEYKATLQDLWFFPPGSDHNNCAYSIRTEVHRDLSITITYTDERALQRAGQE